MKMIIRSYDTYINEKERPAEVMAIGIIGREIQQMKKQIQRIFKSQNLSLRAAQEKKIADEKAVQQRVAEQQEIADEKAAQQRAAQEKEIAEEKEARQRAAEEKKISETKVAQHRAAEEERIAEEKAALQRAAEGRRTAKKKAAQQRAAEQKRLPPIVPPWEVRIAVPKQERTQAHEDLLRRRRGSIQRALKAIEDRRQNLSLRAAEEKRMADENIAQQRAAQEKKIAETNAAQYRAAEEKRIAEEKEAQQRAAEEKRIAEEKAAQQRAAEEKRIAEEKAAQQRAAEQKRLPPIVPPSEFGQADPKQERIRSYNAYINGIVGREIQQMETQIQKLSLLLMKSTHRKHLVGKEKNEEKKLRGAPWQVSSLP